MELNVTLFIIALLSAIGAVSVALVRQSLVFSRKSHIMRMHDRNVALGKRQEEMTRAYKDAQERAKQLEGDRRAALGQLAETQRRIKAAEAESYQVIHELGDPLGNTRLFTGSLAIGPTLTLNQAAARESRLRGVRHTLEVWAESQEEAQRMARTAYTLEAGFAVGKLSPQAAPAMQAA